MHDGTPFAQMSAGDYLQPILRQVDVKKKKEAVAAK
jgi:hypothetical protein